MKNLAGVELEVVLQSGYCVVYGGVGSEYPQFTKDVAWNSSLSTFLAVGV